jgi:hypothetical protein
VSVVLYIYCPAILKRNADLRSHLGTGPFSMDFFRVLQNFLFARRNLLPRTARAPNFRGGDIGLGTEQSETRASFFHKALSDFRMSLLSL